MPIHLVFLFENQMQINNNWPRTSFSLFFSHFLSLSLFFLFLLSFSLFSFFSLSPFLPLSLFSLSFSLFFSLFSLLSLFFSQFLFFLLLFFSLFIVMTEKDCKTKLYFFHLDCVVHPFTSIYDPCQSQTLILASIPISLHQMVWDCMIKSN